MSDDLFSFLLSAAQITLIDIVLSGDNISVIALSVRRLPPKYAEIANITGILGAVLMRIIFASIATILIAIEWLPIKLLGGLLLLSITYDLINQKEGGSTTYAKPEKSFIKAIYNIIAADITMSIDNVLAIAGIARGDISLIIFGLLFNIPILFWGTKIVLKLINKYTLTIYLGAGVLVKTALEMMLNDKLVSLYTTPLFKEVIPLLSGFLLIVYGMISIKLENKKR
ncbi:integral membrane protein TerC family protein [Oxobacter pfennigii]|uniref:Integral membrane protein TerC family protein n=1 Tax=Oxobacter pfennigii TaxID=36849 RepID=A0A0P8YRR7_9CLOT|nr:YjbE family putative metal transport protein [Oxobacter pfennigii]KPU42295.1 integral membrane protein TerC family protein [Oxobacter pfennigii]